MPLAGSIHSSAGFDGKGCVMAEGFRVVKTTGTLARKPILGVNVLRDDGNGGSLMAHIPCSNTADQNRIAAELGELLNELVPKS